MSKSIEFQNSNLYLAGSGLDRNGNKIIKLSFPNGSGFSIQTNGNLPETHRLLSGKKTIKQMQGLTLLELLKIEKEVVSYLKKHGSAVQKSKLKTY